MSYCFVIPCYNHSSTLAATLEGLQPFGFPVIVIDDGSTPEHASVIRQACDAVANTELLVKEVNSGKGGAVITGLLHADKQGYTHAIQVDSDGQHNLADIPAMLKTSERSPQALISGHPVYDESIPKSRLYGRYVTHFWVWVETLSRQIPDSMCGFRIYPVNAVTNLLKHKRIGRRMDFDIEILVRLSWRNMPMVFVPTQVIYPEGGTSNFKALRDNIMISWMHAKLFMGMLMRLPLLLIRKIAGRSSCA